MIILSALSFTTSYHISTTWRFALHLLSLSICQRSLSGMKAEGWSVRNLPPHLHGQTSRGLAETRGLGPQCRAGSRLSYIYNYRDKRIAAHGNTCRANLAGPNDVRPIINIFRKEVFLVNLETSSCSFFRKEVFQPHLPVRLPCYDLAPITSFALGRSSR